MSQGTQHGGSNVLYQRWPKILRRASHFMAGFFIYLGWVYMVSAASPTYISVPATISTPTIWTKTASPYIIAGWDTLTVNSTLILEPGVVVKIVPDHFNRRYSSLVFKDGGRLVALGTSTEPIVVTSYRDDTVAGDTDNDGGNTPPQPGDWSNLIFDNDDSVLSYVDIRYGGSIYKTLSEVEVRNNSRVSIVDSIVSQSQNSGLTLREPSAPLLERLIVENNIGSGISSSLISSVGVLRDSTVRNNKNGALNLPPASTLLITNTNFNNNTPQVVIMTAGTVYQNTTWPSLPGLVYYLTGVVTVLPGVNLSITPGAVIKVQDQLYPNIRILVQGSLSAVGTPDQPIVFTSFKDDSVGGDTNRDGSGSAPAGGNWGGLFFDGSANSNLTYVNLRYGGQYFADFNGSYYLTRDNSLLHIKNSSVALNQVEVKQAGDVGILVEGSSALNVTNSVISGHQRGIESFTTVPWNLSNSRLFNNYYYAMYVGGNIEIDARHNWWGSDTGPALASNPLGTGDMIFGPILYDPWTGKTPANRAPSLRWLGGGGYQSDGVDPSVSFTSLPPTFKVTYADADNNPPASLKLFINDKSYDLSIAPDGDGDFTNGENYTFTLPVGELAKGIYNYYFTASDGTISVRLPEGGALSFEVRYDPVIIIPGILGSAEKNGTWIIDPILHTYDDLIDTLKANGYTYNQDLFTFPYDWHWSNVLTAVELSKKIDEVKNLCHCDKVDLVAHSMGGLVARSYVQSAKYDRDVDQLIFLGTPHLGAPKAYLAWEGGEMDIRRNDQIMKFILSREAKKLGFSTLFNYIRNGPVISVQQLLPIYDYLRGKTTGSLRNYPDNYPQNTFLQDLNNSVANLFNSGVSITNIVGNTGLSDTINFVRVIDSSFLPLWEYGYPDGFDGSTSDRGLERGNGDVTVPIESSNFVNLGLNTISAEYIDLPTKSETIIIKQLTGKYPVVLIDKSRFINLKILIIKILSPVDVVVVAPDGRRIGKDFQTNQEINEIDGAFYSGFIGDDEYITIPNPLDGNYKIETQGTGSGGAYTVAAGYISDNNSVEKDFTGQTLPGMVTDLEITVDKTNPAVLDIKPTDATPPEITVTSPEQKDYLHSDNLSIEVNIFDAGTGLASQEIKFDDKVITDTRIIDLFFEKLGSHKVSVTASDFVGNVAFKEVPFKVVATIDSTISDVERAYGLGWIKNRGVKQSLINKLRAVVRLEKRIEYIKKKLPDKPETIKRVEKWEEKINKLLLKAILLELKLYQNKFINEPAHDLLTEDINWLLNK